MLIEEGLDTGPLVFQKEFPLSSFATTGTLYTHLFEEAAKLLPEVITKYCEGTFKSTPQLQTANSQLLTTKHIHKSDAFIPWDLIQKALHGTDIEKGSRPLFLQQFEGGWPALVERAIRAFSPWPNVWTEVKIKNETKRLKILQAYRNGDDKLRFLKVQLEGKTPISWEQFIKGYPELFTS